MTIRIQFLVSAAALALVACAAAPAPETKAPAAPAVARDVPSNGEIPAENLRGASGSGEYDEGATAVADGNVEGARAIYARMHERDPKDGAAPALLGLIEEKSGDEASAEKAYLDAVRLHAGIEAPYVRLSALLLADKRIGDSLAVARAGLARFPSDAGLHASAATALATKGDQAGASSELDAAVQAAPEDPMLLVAYGHWLASWKQEDAALAKLRAARAVAKDPGALVAVAREMKAIGAFADCVPTLDRAIAIKDSPELRTHRAVCKLGAKDVEGAKADLVAAVNAEYAPAHFYLARLLSSVGDWKGAVAEYESFLKLEPNVPAAKAARESLKVAAAHARR